MPLDWSNERYVRLYVRRTPDMASWCWQALVIWPWLLAGADRAGVIETRRGTRALAALVGGGIPQEVVEKGVEELLGDGCLVATTRGYVLRNYIPAQTAISSGKRRNAEYKARARAADHLGTGEVAYDEVTESGDEVTPGDAVAESVTPGDSEPIRTDPNRNPEDTVTARAGDRHQALVHRVLRRVWEAETAIHAELDLATLKPSPIASAPDQALCLASIHAWLAESRAARPDGDWPAREAHVVARVEHLIAVRTEVSRAFRHTRWWAPATFWDEDGIGKDLRRDAATIGDEARRKSRGGDGPAGRRSTAAIGRAPPAPDHAHASTDAIDPKDITP